MCLTVALPFSRLFVSVTGAFEIAGFVESENVERFGKTEAPGVVLGKWYFCPKVLESWGVS